MGTAGFKGSTLLVLVVVMIILHETVRHLQRRFREHIGNKGPMKSHFELCQINSPSNDIIKILDRSNSLPRLLTLEALYINQYKPKLNTKDEYRSRTLTLKF